MSSSLPMRLTGLLDASPGDLFLPLRAVYEDTFKRLQPKYGSWVIFNHCMPFDVTRAFDEATGYPDPRIWTAQRDIDMWKALEG